MKWQPSDVWKWLFHGNYIVLDHRSTALTETKIGGCKAQPIWDFTLLPYKCTIE